ncbi:MAG: hypothetical protein L3J24_06560 [Xanthomonadales bacterium]|nr:hypothetical protein [Xanthomonadales bacterium]
MNIFAIGDKRSIPQIVVFGFVAYSALSISRYYFSNGGISGYLDNSLFYVMVVLATGILCLYGVYKYLIAEQYKASSIKSIKVIGVAFYLVYFSVLIASSIFSYDGLSNLANDISGNVFGLFVQITAVFFLSKWLYTKYLNR